MKNKVMGKALSWVLSASMVLTMSGAIPAMTATVYAGEPTYPVTEFASGLSEGDVLYLGETTGRDDNTIAWRVMKETSGDAEGTKGYLNIMTGGPVVFGSYTSGGLNTIKNYLSELTVKSSLLQSTTTSQNTSNDRTVTNNGSTLNLADTKAVSAQLYLPSNAEMENADPGPTNTWTRNTIKVVSQGAADKTDYSTYAAANDKGNTVSAKTSNVGFIAEANLSTDKTNGAFLATQADAESDYYLTLIDSSISAPAISSASLSGSTVTVKLGSAVPNGYTLKYLETSKAYTESDAEVKAYGDAAAVESDTTGKTFSAAMSSTEDMLYFLLEKSNAGTTSTHYVSAPAAANWITAPTAANFSIGSLSYAGMGGITANTILEDIMAKEYAAGSSVGDVINGHDGSEENPYTEEDITITALKQGSTSVAEADFNKTAFNVGSYEVWGTINAQGTGNNDDETDAITFGTTASAIKLGDLKITAKEVSGNDFTIALPALTQYSHNTDADLTYTEAAVPVTMNDAPFTEDKINATNVKITLKDKTQTAAAGKGLAKTSKVVISALDNSNYVIANTNIVLTAEQSIDVTAVKMTGINIKTQPTKLYYVEGDVFSPAGLVITATYEGGTTSDITYADTSAWTFNPAKSTVLTEGTKTIKVSYTDPVSGKTFTAATPVTITVNAENVDVTSISIPASDTVDVGGTVAFPTVTYDPTNTNIDRTVTWTADLGSTDPAKQYAEFIDADGTKVNGKLVSGTVYTAPATAVGIRALEAGAGKDVALAASVTKLVNGTTSDTETISISEKSNSVEWMRLSGDTRYDTAAEIAQEAFPDGVESGAAVLVSGNSFADALSANAFAGLIGAPILLTDTSSLPSQTASLIKEWGIDTIYIIGGPSVVTENVIKTLKATVKSGGCGVTTVKRIYGSDRYATSEAVYTAGLQQNMPWGDSVVIATGAKAADALSIASWCYSKKMPLLLANNGELSGSALTIAGSFANAYILGGTAAVSANTYSELEAAGLNVERLSGDDRYATSVAIADYFAGDEPALYNETAFASGYDANYPDALVAGMLQGQANDGNGAPVILINGTSGAGFDYVAANYPLVANNVRFLYFLGGLKAMPKATVDTVLANWNTSTELLFGENNKT